MRFLHVAAILTVLCAFAGVAASTAPKTPAPAKKTSKSHSTSKTSSSTAKKATGKTVLSKSKLARSKSSARTPASTWRTRQQSPTPDRYKEIQQALVKRGYLKSEPSGVWDAASMDAMQRFQTDQNLPATGKITAPALIALGLGARSAGAPEVPPLGQSAASPPGETAASPAGPGAAQPAPQSEPAAAPATPGSVPAAPPSASGPASATD